MTIIYGRKKYPPQKPKEPEPKQEDINDEDVDEEEMTNEDITREVQSQPQPPRQLWKFVSRPASEGFVNTYTNEQLTLPELLVRIANDVAIIKSRLRER